MKVLWKPFIVYRCKILQKIFYYNNCKLKKAKIYTVMLMTNIRILYPLSLKIQQTQQTTFKWCCYFTCNKSIYMISYKSIKEKMN